MDKEIVTRMQGFAGNPYGVEEIRFTFVVVVGGEEKARRAHIWRPQAGTHTVTDKGVTATIQDLRAADLGEVAKGEDPTVHQDRLAELVPGVSPKDAARTIGQAINDTFWLIAPSKVTDPGVDIDVTDTSITAKFLAGGVTPGDSYTFRVDDSGKVTAWSYVLGSGRTGESIWVDYEDFGPLRLSLLRQGTDGGFELRFEDVSVH